MDMRGSRTVLRRALAVALLGLLAGAGYFASYHLSAPTAQAAVVVETTLVAVADSHVASDVPSQNYATSAKIRVDGSPTVRSYLKFNLSSISGTVTKAVLQLTAMSSHSTGFSVRDAADTSWAEGSLTYTNAPPVSATIAASTGAFSSGQLLSLDVTSIVRAGGYDALALTDRGSVTALALSSKEGAAAPRLIVTSSSDPATTTATTPTTTTTATTTTTTTTTTTIPTTTTTTTTVPASGDPVIAAAGDIACDPASSSFNGGLGTSSSCRELYVSDLLVNAGLAAVLPLGDVQYEVGSLSQFQNSYDRSWGRVKSITRPSVGNHDYLTSGAAGYFQYFGAAAGDPAKGYYSYDIGAWHLIALNSNCSKAGGCGAGSPQEVWLRNDLAAHPSRCTLAYWHHPRWNAGQFTDDAQSDALVRALYAAGADVILAGHDHDYQRYAPQDPSGNLDTANGIRQFIAGTGGKNHMPSSYSFNMAKRNLEVANRDTFGVLKLTLHATSYDWQFVPEPGKSFTDSGTGQCH